MLEIPSQMREKNTHTNRKKGRKYQFNAYYWVAITMEILPARFFLLLSMFSQFYFAQCFVAHATNSRVFQTTLSILSNVSCRINTCATQLIACLQKLWCVLHKHLSAETYMHSSYWPPPPSLSCSKVFLFWFWIPSNSFQC